MKIINFDPNVEGIADAKCLEKARELLNEDIIYTSNSLVVTFARGMVRRGELKNLSVVAESGTRIIPINSDGGFCEVPSKELTIINEALEFFLYRK